MKKPQRPARAAKPKKRGPETNTGWHVRFIAEMLKFPNVSAACEVCGVSWSTVHRHRTQFPGFAEAWDDARRKAADLLEQAAIERATRGTLRPVYQGGVKVGEVREHSDTLAAFLLKGLKPEIYGDRSKIEHSGKVTLTEEEELKLGAAGLESIMATIRYAAMGGK